MLRKYLGVAGVVTLLLAIGVGVYTNIIDQRARSRDDTRTGHGVVVSDFPPCTWDVGLPQRILSENNSHTIIVTAANPNDTECQSEISFLAPGFEVSPRKDTQTVSAKAKASGSIAWIVVPKTAGAFELAVSDGINTRTIGVTVTNIFGLTATQSQFVTTLGSLFGPMLTVPWWFERWQQRKRNRRPTTPSTAAAAAQTPPSPNSDNPPES